MKRFKKVIFTLLTFVLVLAMSPVIAQDQNERHKKQDEILQLFINAHSIMDEYNDVTYTYVYENGKVTNVHIVGVPIESKTRELASYLMKLEKLKSELINLQDETGVYYVTETEPEPKDGYVELYRELRDNLNYPATAEELGIEGTVLVKFIVDSDGSIKNLKTTDNIETSYEEIEKEMIKEAKAAVKSTSGDWVPAKVGETAVEQWVYIPVKFKMEES